jgi:hypothetical protein
MKNNNIIKLAGAIKPPASKTEIIEALAIRKRDQIIEENKRLVIEKAQLETKIQIVAREEAANAKPKSAQRFYVRCDKANDGRLDVRNISVDYEFEPSAELRELARRLYRIDHSNIHSTPSLYEVRNQVRAAVNQQTPPAERVSSLLKDPKSQDMLDAILTALDKKPLALVG